MTSDYRRSGDRERRHDRLSSVQYGCGRTQIFYHYHIGATPDAGTSWMRYRHATSCTVVEQVTAGIATVVTNFIVVRTMQTGEQIVFATGRYLDRIRTEGEDGRPQFEARIVFLDSRAVDTLFAIPL